MEFVKKISIHESNGKWVVDPVIGANYTPKFYIEMMKGAVALYEKRRGHRHYDMVQKLEVKNPPLIVDDVVAMLNNHIPGMHDRPRFKRVVREFYECKYPKTMERAQKETAACAVEKVVSELEKDKVSSGEFTLPIERRIQLDKLPAKLQVYMVTGSEVRGSMEEMLIEYQTFARDINPEMMKSLKKDALVSCEELKPFFAEFGKLKEYYEKEEDFKKQRKQVRKRRLLPSLKTVGVGAATTAATAAGYLLWFL